MVCADAFVYKQKAERLEAVRRHVRNRISQQKHQEQRELEDTSNSSLLIKNTNNAMVQGTPQCQGHTEGKPVLSSSNPFNHPY